MAHHATDPNPDALVAAARSHALGDLLRRSAARYPDKVAVIDGGRRFTYAQFDAAVDALAAQLAAAGLRRGDRFALLSRNCWQFAALDFATARLGLILVPMNFMLTTDELAYIIDDARPAGIVAEDALAGRAADACERAGVAPVLRGRIALGDDGVAAGDGPRWTDVAGWAAGTGIPPPVAVGDDDVIRLMYTSGTESRPKGVMLSSRSLIAQYVSCIVEGEMSRQDIELHALPLYHCAQLDSFLGPNVYLGGTNVILPGPKPEAVLAAIETHGVTKFFAPPTVWIGLLRCPLFDETDLSSLRKGYYGASPMPVEVLREIQRRLPDLRLWNFYGQTELSPLATVLPPHEQVEFAGAAGRPALNVETRVVDALGDPVAPGVVGEVVHRSPHAASGYWNDPDKTREAFADGWFHSGDLGVFSEAGRLTLVDRKKDMISTGGENVASREVEEAIYLHPAVAEAAVFALPDDTWVEAVSAAVVLRPGEDLDEAGLRAHCAGRLAGFKVPKRIFVVESLPKNPSGKILKRSLRQTFG